VVKTRAEMSARRVEARPADARKRFIRPLVDVALEPPGSNLPEPAPHPKQCYKNVSVFVCCLIGMSKSLNQQTSSGSDRITRSQVKCPCDVTEFFLKSYSAGLKES
jgi:hypothetical protein